jgi:hypothetical protein
MDAGMTTPDRGVTVESGAHPRGVCHAGYSLSGGTLAYLDIYDFDDAASADAGYQTLADAASAINPEYDAPTDSPDVSGAAPDADALHVACAARVGNAWCGVVSRYGHRVYWLSVSHLAPSGLTQDDLYRLVEAMNSKLMSSP